MLNNFKLENLKKPTNKKWKSIADYIIYTILPGLITATAFMPISESAQKWIIYGITILSIGFKALSKFTVEENLENTENEVNK